MIGKKNILLYPFAILYGIIVSIRNTLFDMGILKSKEFSIRVVCVGNITVGGTGKTPHVEYLTKLLSDIYTIAVISRGYKRKSKGYRMVNETCTAAQVGDEPLQIKRKFPDVAVAVDAKRARGISNLLNYNKSINVVILDDAYQHRYVKSSLSVLLIDYSRLITKDYLMPYGFLRESSSQRKRANILIVTKTPEYIPPIERRIIEKELKPYPYQNMFFTRIIYKQPVNLFPEQTADSLFNFSKRKYDVLLLTGIANPELLQEHIKIFSKRITPLKYSDHYLFKKKDLENILIEFENYSQSIDKVIITTEKDAVRLITSPFKEIICNIPIFYVPIEVGFLTEVEHENFNKTILKYVKTDISISTIYSK